jgi:hypothetical protein
VERLGEPLFLGQGTLFRRELRLADHEHAYVELVRLRVPCR